MSLCDWLIPKNEDRSDLSYSTFMASPQICLMLIRWLLLIRLGHKLLLVHICIFTDCTAENAVNSQHKSSDAVATTTVDPSSAAVSSAAAVDGGNTGDDDAIAASTAVTAAEAATSHADVEQAAGTDHAKTSEKPKKLKPKCVRVAILKPNKGGLRVKRKIKRTSLCYLYLICNSFM